MASSLAISQPTLSLACCTQLRPDQVRLISSCRTPTSRGSARCDSMHIYLRYHHGDALMETSLLCNCTLARTACSGRDRNHIAPVRSLWKGEDHRLITGEASPGELRSFEMRKHARVHNKGGRPAFLSRGATSTFVSLRVPASLTMRWWWHEMRYVSFLRSMARYPSGVSPPPLRYSLRTQYSRFAHLCHTIMSLHPRGGRDCPLTQLRGQVPWNQQLKVLM